MSVSGILFSTVQKVEQKLFRIRRGQMDQMISAMLVGVFV